MSDVRCPNCLKRFQLLLDAVRCPNCLKRIPVPLKAETATCPYCKINYRISWAASTQAKIRRLA